MGMITLLDDHTTRLLNQETVALAYLVASPAHIIETATALILVVKDEHVWTPTVEVLDMKDTLSRRSTKTYANLLVWGQALLKLNYLRGYSLEHPFGGIALIF